MNLATVLYAVADRIATITVNRPDKLNALNATAKADLRAAVSSLREDPAVGAPHAWFAGYTQAHRPDKPDIVMVVMIENVGEGSQFAAPLFKRMAEIYFLGRAYSLLPWEAEFSGTPTETPAP